MVHYLKLKIAEKSTRLLHARFSEIYTDDELEAVILVARLGTNEFEAIVPLEDKEDFTRLFPVHFEKKGTVIYRIVNGQAVPIKMHLVGQPPVWLGNKAEDYAMLTACITKAIVAGYTRDTNRIKRF